jgi:hypothetical protein
MWVHGMISSGQAVNPNQSMCHGSSPQAVIDLTDCIFLACVFEDPTTKVILH